MEIPNQCPQCQADVRHIPAGISKKTGKPYGEFYACEAKCGWTLKIPKVEPKPQPAPLNNGMAILHDEMVAEFKKLNERFDKLVIFLTKK